MYIAAFIIPVPDGNEAAYRNWAENGASLFKEYGCLEIVDAWEDNISDGDQTDFRRAVDARPSEKIVLSWQIWPDKATVDSAEAAMKLDARFDIPSDVPFDYKRLVLGGFRPIHTMGRSG